jgi:hypothetical protein
VKKVTCPECAGYGFNGIEEDTGAPFACYFCGTTGLVSAEVMAEVEQERVEQELRSTYLPNRQQRHGYDHETGEPLPPMYGLFERLEPWALRRPVGVCDPSEDIPF